MYLNSGQVSLIECIIYILAYKIETQWAQSSSDNKELNVPFLLEATSCQIS